MPRTELGFSESALIDLEAIKAWYAEEGVPEVGSRFVEEIVQRIENLHDHPEMGRIVPEFGQPFLRELVHPPFRVIYHRNPSRVRIVRVWRSERLLELADASRI